MLLKSLFNSDERTNNLNDARLVRFGKVTYYPKRFTLVVEGKEKTITNKTAQILNFLIQNQKKSFTRHDIVRAVWQDKGCSEANFYKAIEKLRKDLGDNNEPWKYIVKPSTNQFTLKPNAKIYVKNTYWKHIKTTFKSIIIFVFFSSIISAAYSTFTAPNFTRGFSKPITTLKGEVQHAVLSPDEKVLLFMQKRNLDSGWDLIAKQLDTSINQVISAAENKDEYNTEPSFSPSGNQIAWVKTDYNKNCHVMVAVFNSDNLTITNQRAVLECAKYYYARTPNWKNEHSLIISMAQKGESPSNIILFDLLTEKIEPLTSPTNSVYGDYSLYYNNVANKIAYLRQGSSTGKGVQLRIFDFNSYEDSLLKEYQHVLYSAVWMTSDKIIVNAENHYEIINTLSQEIFKLRGNLEPEEYPFWMGENKIGFVKGHLQDKDLIITDLDNNKTLDWLSSIGNDYRAAIAKETNNIAFISNRDNKNQLFYSINKSIKPLASFNHSAYFTDIAISPNGKYIALIEIDLLRVLTSNGTEIHRQSDNIEGISFSFDSKSLYLGIKNDNNPSSIEKLELNTFKQSTLIAQGFMPKATKNGDIYFLTSEQDSGDIWLNKYSAKKLKKLIKIPFPAPQAKSNSYDVLNDKLYYVKTQEGKQYLSFIDMKTNQTTLVREIESKYFSINSSENLLITTRKNQVQNNLSYFEILEKK